MFLSLGKCLFIKLFEMVKECIECGEPILGRVDKKYCSDLCRNSFNNKVNSNSSNYVRNVNSMLRRNRKILEELAPSAPTKISRDKLLQKGFNFHYHTNIYHNQKGGNQFFCYEYGYVPLEKDRYMLIRRNEDE